MLRRAPGCLLPLLVIATASSDPLSAQVTDPELIETDRIRAFTAGIREPTVGRFVGYEGPVLIMDPGKGELIRLDLDRVDRLERVSEGSFGFWKGAAIGAGGTLVGGFLVQVFAGSEYGPSLAMASAVLLAPAAGLLGGFIGSAIRVESWEEVTIRDPPVR